jgi:uncharacterized membrane protein
MSSVSQTAPRPRAPFGARVAMAMAAAGLVVILALGPAGAQLVRIAATGRLHGPDMALWASLSLAIKVHVLAALAALVLGGVLMTARKGRRFHRLAGWVWVSLVSVTAGASLFITSLNHGKWSLLHLLTGWTLIMLPLAVIAAKRRSVTMHRRRMMGLFYGGFVINLLIAFIPGRALWMIFFG